MPQETEFTKLLNRYTLEERVFLARLDSGEEPPEIDEVIGAYAIVRQDLNWAWQLSEVLIHLENDLEMDEGIGARINFLRGFDVLHEGHEVERFFGFWWSNSRNPEPVARIVGSQHSNPLETLILVTAVSTVIIIVGAIWAVRKWRQSKSDERISESLSELIESVAGTIAEGDPKRIAAVMPVAKGIVAAGLKRATDKLSIDLAKTAKVSFE